MRLGDVVKYYSRDDVQQALVKAARDREVAGVFRNGSFGKRPNALSYPQDVLSMVRQGVMEFHCSVERWTQPMALRQDNYNELRKGWDLMLDIDCDAFEHGRAAALAFCRALERHGIRNFSVKFTGGKGFHIGVPWESMPSEVNYKPSARQYPELARKIAAYLKEYARDDVEKELLRTGSPEKIAEQLKRPLSELVAGAKPGQAIDPYRVIDVDPILISARHLFRMPYSIHKASFLVSLPVKPSELGSFQREMAKPDSVRPVLGFLHAGEKGEADALVAEALDWHAKAMPEESRPAPKLYVPKQAIAKEHFPPCVQNILNGLQDGRKRSLFILTNFLSSAGWKTDAIESMLLEWNEKNMPPLREGYIRTHARWHEARLRAGQKSLPPPGCKKEGYYESIGICQPDSACGGQAKTIKNPVNYAFRKAGVGREERIKPGYKPKRMQARRHASGSARAKRGE